MSRFAKPPIPPAPVHGGMSTEDFAVFQKILLEKSGIVLTNNKRALVESRVRQRLICLGMNSYGKYLELLQRDRTGEELVQLIDVISTNVTRFFREGDHFEFLDEKVGKWAAAGEKRLRFWSAACSTGEEPYSLAMTLHPHMTANKLDLKILATDISTRVLAHGQAGWFQENRLTTVPDQMKKRFFTRNPAGGDDFEVSDELKQMIMFRRLNFTVFPYPIKGVFDVILCRNAMIYFDKSLRTKMIHEFSRFLRPGGYLLIGHAETLIGIQSEYRTVRSSIYQRSNIGGDM